MIKPHLFSRTLYALLLLAAGAALPALYACLSTGERDVP